MGWFDNLWRRWQGSTTSEEDVVHTDERQQKDKREEADELEELAHELRDEEVFNLPRKPPGTG